MGYPSYWPCSHNLLIHSDSPMNNYRPLPSTAARSGSLEGLAFFRDPDFARQRYERFGNIFETLVFGQRTVFIRGDRAIADLLSAGDAMQGWWPDSLKQLLGSPSCWLGWGRNSIN
jgi:hypothetical protein